MKSILKFITCGSVDDGKSTLIGHMLYDAKLIFADQEKTLEMDSRLGSNNGEIDYSLLLDGLMAEREQGITIDVAYRYFTTEKRSFIVADCPGHEQYTRNMAVGASFASLAVILVDATKGMLSQTMRHVRICSLLGIKHFVLIINKMDLVNYDKHVFEEICKEFKTFCANFELESIQCIPVSATVGDNITKKSLNMTWYKELTLLEYLNEVDVDKNHDDENFILPIQRVSRPNANFRGFQGQVKAGTINVDDEIITIPHFETAKVKEIYLGDKSVNSAINGQPITITLDKEIDISRGSVITSTNINKVSFCDMFRATMLWTDDKPLVEGKSYLIKLGTKVVPATLMKIIYKVDINTGKHIEAKQIYKNEIVVCDINVSENIAVAKNEDNDSLSRFIFIDRLTNMTSSCGVVTYPLNRSTNIQWQNVDVTKELRVNQKEQKSATLWFTGLSGSGKSTIANALEKKLLTLNKHTILLDGDNIRHGLNKNLGFTVADRIENIRRVAEVSKLMNDAGLICLVSFISPFDEDRENAKNIIGDDFIEIYISTPIEECEKRDVKGLYKKARAGEISNFTGISSPYEEPKNADIIVDTSKMTIDEAVEFILIKIKNSI